MQFSDQRSWPSILGGLVLSASLFTGCAPEKPIPVSTETIHGPDVGLLLNRRVLVPATLKYVRDVDDSSLTPMYGMDAQGHPTIIGYMPDSDTDYLYNATVEPSFEISTVGNLRTERPIHKGSKEPISATLSGVLRRDDSGGLRLEQIRLEALESQAAERE